MQVQWVQIQSIKGIPRRTLALAPFLHLCWAKIMRSIDITSFPLASLKSFQSAAFSLCFLIFEESQAVG